jgi:hypothetical protein
MIQKHLDSAATGQPPLKLAYPRLEAAQIISVSPATLDRLAERGLLRPSRATRRPLYTRVDLERFLRETTTSIN